VVDEASVVAIDKDVPLDLASLVACGVSAGGGAVRHRARAKKNDTVLVVGCGGDGMNVVQGAQLCGASKIIAADIVPAKLVWAQEFGATDTLATARGAHQGRASAHRWHRC
jgi:alcohol dehydrogenase/S-(hydroxymethyl)glutathione dehydrogenase/alcohol dehydrogenase